MGLYELFVLKIQFCIYGFLSQIIFNLAISKNNFYIKLIMLLTLTRVTGLVARA